MACESDELNDIDVRKFKPMEVEDEVPPVLSMAQLIVVRTMMAKQRARASDG